jgi:PAS domain S-box-containing protein
MKILVVDDDPHILALTSAILESGGYEIIEASTGKDALEAVTRVRPDLVILDVVLPDMSGFEVCKRIKSDPALRGIFVALHSGISTSSQAQTTGLDIGADGYIVKGIPANELIARVNSLVRIKKAEDALQRAHDELDQRVKERTAELLAANQRLVTSEKALLERLRFERLLSDLSARVIYAGPAEIDREIGDALKRVVDFFQVTNCSLIKGSPDSNTAVITHAAHATDAEPLPIGIDVVPLFPWTSKMLQRGEVVRVTTLDDLPVEAVVDKEIYRKLGVRSILTIPISFEGTIRYTVSIASRSEERAWPEEYIPRLQMMGEILINTLERKRAREQLEERLRFETLLAEISAHFVALAADQVDSQIEDAQRRVCEFLGLDRSMLWQSSGEDAAAPMRLTHVYQSSGVQPPKGLEGRTLFPWTSRRVLRGEAVLVSKMGDLPPEAARDRETWRQYETKSILLVPLLAGGGTILGSLSFAYVREERDWPEMVVRYLQLLAQVFANALSRKRADEALRKSEERLHLAADAAEIGLWSRDLATNHLWNSEGSYRLLGLDKSVNLTDELFFSLVHPDDRERLRQAMTEAVVSGRDARAEYRIIRPDGAVRWLITRARPYFTPSGEPDRLTGVTLDITERKLMEAKIQKAAEEWQSTFDSVQEQVMILDKDFRVTRVNAPALSFLGLPLEGILGKHCFALMHETNKPADLCPVPRMMETKMHEERELYDEKTNSWFQVSVAPILDNQGQITRVVHAIRDLTQHKKAEAEAFNARRELLRTERLLRMGELTASLAHELNQPLTSILSNARAALRFLEAGRLETDQLREILEDIARDDKRAGDIIRSLRSMIKPEEGDQEIISMNDVLTEVSTLFHSEAIIRNIGIEMDCANLLSLVSINKIQIQQVLINLMMNAAESMLDALDVRKIVLQTRAIDGGAVQVAVRDFGPGVEEEDLGKLFEPFFTTKRSGLGMGLSLSRSIIEAHGGHVWVKNNPDRGATFYFDLPGAERQ